MRCDRQGGVQDDRRCEGLRGEQVQLAGNRCHDRDKAPQTQDAYPLRQVVDRSQDTEPLLFAEGREISRQRSSARPAHRSGSPPVPGSGREHLSLCRRGDVWLERRAPPAGEDVEEQEVVDDDQLRVVLRAGSSRDRRLLPRGRPLRKPPMPDRPRSLGGPRRARPNGWRRPSMG